MLYWDSVNNVESIRATGFSMVERRRNTLRGPK
jgi:hypothetical protein